jgi:hypothetical protein
MIMKRLIALFMTLVALTACQKDSFPLTMDAAIKKVEKVIKQYPHRDWFASKSIIEPGTVLKYSKFGQLWDDPELIHEYVSPNYRAWLVVIATDESYDSSPDECLHLFIDADTGNYTEKWLKGQAIVEWGSTPFSRAAQSNGGK